MSDKCTTCMDLTVTVIIQEKQKKKNENSDGNITKLEQEEQKSWQAYSIWA